MLTVSFLSFAFFSSVLAVIAEGSSYVSPAYDFSFLPDIESAAIKILKEPSVQSDTAGDIINSLRLLSCSKCALFNRDDRSELYSDDFLSFLVTPPTAGSKGTSAARLSLASNLLDAKRAYASQYTPNTLSALAKYVLSATVCVPESADTALCVVRMLVDGLYLHMDSESVLSTLLGVLRTYHESSEIAMGVAATVCKMLLSGSVPEQSYLCAEVVLEVRRVAESEGCTNELFLEVAWALLSGVYRVQGNDCNIRKADGAATYKQLIKTRLPSN